MSKQLTTARDALLVDGNDHEFRAMVHDLLAFSSRLDNIRNRFGAYVGLTGIQYTILISISHSVEDEGVGVAAIAKHLGLSGPFVTIETSKLVKLDLVEKRVNAQDRRRVLLTITERGQELLDQLAPIQRQVNDKLFESLDEEGFRSLCVTAHKLKQDADKALNLADYLASESSETKGEI